MMRKPVFTDSVTPEQAHAELVNLAEMVIRLGNGDGLARGDDGEEGVLLATLSRATGIPEDVILYQTRWMTEVWWSGPFLSRDTNAPCISLEDLPVMIRYIEHDGDMVTMGDLVKLRLIQLRAHAAIRLLKEAPSAEDIVVAWGVCKVVAKRKDKLFR